MTGGGGGRPAVGFLSDEWFAALEKNLRSAASRHDRDGGGPAPLRLGIRLTGVPWAADGQFVYTVVIAEDAAVIVGGDEEADVVLVGDYEAARDLAQGRQTAGDLLEGGSIKVGGDVARLLSAGEILSALSLAHDRGGSWDGESAAPEVTVPDPEH